MASQSWRGWLTFLRATALINLQASGSYFDAVQVWIDADQNGVSIPGEVKALAQLGFFSTTRFGPGLLKQSIAMLTKT